MPPNLPESLSIRPMRPTERAAIQSLGARLFEPFGDYTEALHRWLRSPGVVSSVASHPEQGLVGFALLGLLDDGDGGTQAYLLGIGVEPQWRRLGLGRQLLGTSLEEARRLWQRWGVEDVQLEVAQGNSSALGLFRDAGFLSMQRGGTGADRCYPNGDPAVTMSLALC